MRTHSLSEVQVDDPRVGILVDVMDELRKSDGLTTEKLRSQPELIKLLVDKGTAEEAKTELEHVVLGMGDGYQARAVRNSLVISNGSDGIEARGGPEKRREWATGFDDRSKPKEDLFIPRNVRTHATYEEKGFKELARLILDRAKARAAITAKQDTFAYAAKPELTVEGSGDLHDERDDALRDLHDGGDHEPAASEPGLTNGSRAPWWRRPIYVISTWPEKRRSQVIGAAGLLAMGLIMAIVLVTVPRGNTSKQEPSNGLWWPSQPPAAINTPADESIDNTRGWGPDRAIFTMSAPASTPVFNSITNTSNHGDERNFVQCRDKEDGNEAYADELIARDGHTYTCFVLFNNAIAPNKEKELGEDGLLQNSRLRALLPPANTYNPGIVGKLSADNSISVWDSCNFISPRRITITYVPRSVWMITEHTPKEGLPLDEAYEGSAMTSGILAGSGALIGSRGRDGWIGQVGGYVLFDVTVELGS